MKKESAACSDCRLPFERTAAAFSHAESCPLLLQSPRPNHCYPGKNTPHGFRKGCSVTKDQLRLYFFKNHEEHVQLCLNSMEIENYEMCSKQILEHCILNDFKDFRFSYDVNGYPDKIVATIFLAQDDIKENNPIF